MLRHYVVMRVDVLPSSGQVNAFALRFAFWFYYEDFRLYFFLFFKVRLRFFLPFWRRTNGFWLGFLNLFLLFFNRFI